MNLQKISNFLFARNQSPVDRQELLDYYEKAGPDYAAWSPNYNMHFGYYQAGMSPFKREHLLENMNAQVLANLGIDPQGPSHLVDLGCGLGATLRHACNQYPLLQCHGVTIVPWQKERADVLNDQHHLGDRINVYLDDYTQTAIQDESMDHVLAIESSCYASGPAKEDLLREILRILKPGGSFVIADGFLKTNKPMNRLLKRAYDQLCRSWALTELGNINGVCDSLESLGFSEVERKDVSWNVAPSVAHVPHTVLGFLLKQLLFGKQAMNKERWDNLKSPLLTMVLGLHQKHFGYFLVKGTKPKRETF